MEWKRWGRRASRATRDRGFTMIEVVIAILTITAFLTGTLQLLAINALYKARSERQTRANFWIQEDMEEVKSMAEAIDSDDYPDACKSGYADALKTALGRPTGNYTDQVVASRNLVNKQYQLIREYPSGQTSLHRLRINYKVRSTEFAGRKAPKDYVNQETVIATSSFEVIPDASFQCP